MVDDRSFRKLLSGFVISAGPQVVLKVAKALSDGEQFKPPGSVGVVLESPPDNRQPYLICFAAGETVEAYFQELRTIRQAFLSKHVYKTYSGSVLSQFRRMANNAYRVLMTGIHLLRTGEVEANLLRLNEPFGFGFLDELIARKVGGEDTSIGDLDWSFHEVRLAELEAQLDRAFAESPLPEDRERRPVNELLVRLRLGSQ